MIGGFRFETEFAIIVAVFSCFVAVATHRRVLFRRGLQLAGVSIACFKHKPESDYHSSYWVQIAIMTDWNHEKQHLKVFVCHLRRRFSVFSPQIIFADHEVGIMLAGIWRCLPAGKNAKWFAVSNRRRKRRGMNDWFGREIRLAAQCGCRCTVGVTR